MYCRIKATFYKKHLKIVFKLNTHFFAGSKKFLIFCIKKLIFFGYGGVYNGLPYGAD